MNLKQKLLDTADAYCNATGRARSGVGLLIFNDAKFFDRLEDGDCRLTTYEKAMEWFDENMPRKGSARG